MFQLQLKRIEAAIAAERLDEAFQWLLAAPQREHRDGQRVTDLLIEKLVSRSRRHLGEQRLSEARSDAEKAQRLAGRTCEVAALVDQIAAAALQARSQQDAERESQQQAKLMAQLGCFTLGQTLLPSGPTPSRLAAEIERKRTIAIDAAERLQCSIASGDSDAALQILRSLDAEILRHRLVAEKVSAVVQPMVENAFSDLAGGRLDRAMETLKRVQSVSPELSRLEELKTCLNHCVRAIEMIGQARYVEAEHQLAIVAQMVDQSRWIHETLQSIEEILRRVTNLRSGPLGLLENGECLTDLCSDQDPVLQPEPLPPSLSRVRHLGQSSELASILRVDGLGSILLLRGNRVSIGSYSQSKRYDLPLLIEGLPDPVYIRRAGDDYFAESASEFQLNDQATTRRLLASGDLIGIGRKGRLRFRQDVPASASALLQLSGSVLAKREIRHVALMADSLLFSNQGGHFSLPEGGQPIVVYLGHSGYAIKYAGIQGDAVDLEPGRSVLFGETRFTLNSIHLS